MARPDDVPEWASDANYSAGSEAWSATPTKVEPTSSEKDQGAEPLTGFGAQQLNWLFNNKAAWINHHDALLLGADFFLADDFVGAAIDSGNWASSANAAIIDDSAAGGFGSIKLDGGAGAANIYTAALGMTTNDFVFNVRVRTPTKTSSSAIFGVAGKAEFIWTNGSANWVAYIDSVPGPGSFSNTGVAVSTSYQVLTIERRSNVLYFSINGTQYYSGAFTTSLAGLTFGCSITNVATADTRIDGIKLWIAR